MSENEIRQGSGPFYDNKHFARGFSKSGNFTLAEDEMLTYFGKTLIALENGELEPINDAEKHFVKVVQQQVEPETKLERTWLKYVLLSRGRKHFHTLNSRKNSPPPAEDLSNDYILEDDD